MTDIATRVYNHTWKIDPIVRSVLDTDFYTSTDPLQRSFSRPVSEDDDLTGSTKGLATGYGQTKWVLRRTDAGCRCSRIESVDSEAGICDWRVVPGNDDHG